MDLFRLHDTTFLPSVMIQGWDSLIWTERFTGVGEFKLETYNIGTKSSLPLNCMVKIRQSNQIMVVESWDIQRDDYGNYKLVVSGRSFEKIFEDRAVSLDLQEGKDDPYQFKANPMAAAYKIIREQLVLGIHDSKDAVPNLLVSNGSGGPPDSRSYSFRPQTLAEAVDKIREDSEFGVRTSATTLDADNPSMQMYLYSGRDRTKGNTAGTTPVLLSVKAGHLGSVRYFWSNKDFKNWAYVYAPIGTWRKSAQGYASASGRGRKVAVAIASDITKVQSGMTFDEMMIERGRQEVAKHVFKMAFDGKVSPNTPYVFGTHYGLGDKLTILGDFGIEEDVRVAEYVRSHDRNGEEAYPTLVSVGGA